jgi:hypothetical protein
MQEHAKMPLNREEENSGLGRKRFVEENGHG